MIPTIIANMNPRRLSPPKTKMAKSTIKVVKDVFNVRLKVLFKASFTCSPLFHPFRLTISRIRSNTTTVSFKEYPITVRIAAIKA